jgi:hypothetical protein
MGEMTRGARLAHIRPHARRLFEMAEGTGLASACASGSATLSEFTARARVTHRAEFVADTGLELAAWALLAGVGQAGAPQAGQARILVDAARVERDGVLALGAGFARALRGGRATIPVLALGASFGATTVATGAASVLVVLASGAEGALTATRVNLESSLLAHSASNGATEGALSICALEAELSAGADVAHKVAGALGILATRTSHAESWGVRAATLQELARAAGLAQLALGIKAAPSILVLAVRASGALAQGRRGVSTSERARGTSQQRRTGLSVRTDFATGSLELSSSAGEAVTGRASAAAGAVRAGGARGAGAARGAPVADDVLELSHRASSARSAGGILQHVFAGRAIRKRPAMLAPPALGVEALAVRKRVVLSTGALGTSSAGSTRELSAGACAARRRAGRIGKLASLASRAEGPGRVAVLASGARRAFRGTFVGKRAGNALHTAGLTSGNSKSSRSALHAVAFGSFALVLPSRASNAHRCNADSNARGGGARSARLACAANDTTLVFVPEAALFVALLAIGDERAGFASEHGANLDLATTLVVAVAARFCAGIPPSPSRN